MKVSWKNQNDDYTLENSDVQNRGCMWFFRELYSDSTFIMAPEFSCIPNFKCSFLKVTVTKKQKTNVYSSLHVTH